MICVNFIRLHAFVVEIRTVTALATLVMSHAHGTCDDHVDRTGRMAATPCNPT